MELREATAADEPALSESLLRPAYRDAASVAPEFNALDEEAVAVADAGRWLDHEDRALFVAEADGELVGYASAIQQEPAPIYARGPEAHVDGLYVKPERRREGVARALLDRVEAWAADRGCEHVGVTVHADNEAARALYADRYELTFESYRGRLE